MASEDIVVATARRIMGEVLDPQTLNRATGEDWKATAWRALEDAGLTLAWVPEVHGGAGASMEDGFAIVREAGRCAAPVPICETLLAGWLLGCAGISVPKGTMTCAPTREGDCVRLGKSGALEGRLRAVPFARDAEFLALVAECEVKGGVVALLETRGLAIAEGVNLAGDAQNAVVLSAVRPLALEPAPAGVDGRTLRLMGAIVRAVQMTGALEAVLELAVAYANERVAFERPIAKFQAVQHSLARLAGEVAAAMAASGSAAEVAATRAPSEEAVLLEGASAKIRVGEAAGEGAGIAHQVLGAIGFTREHTLHRFTRRLWAWRDDFGNESSWAVTLGGLVAGKGADALWPMLAER